MTLEVFQAVAAQRESLLMTVGPHVGPALGVHLPKMGDASLFNLVTGLVAVTTAGIAGDLIIRVPRKVTDRVEVDWRSACN